MRYWRWELSAPHRAGGNGLAEPARAGNGCQRPLVPRFGFQARLKPGVDMIDIATCCAKRTYKSDFWRNSCVNHHYFLICTQGKS
jgi:hypothetical protein